ncbi:Os03g0753600, partial [Oryza sativa Japonica Group]
ISVESCKILSAGCINPPHPGLPLDHHPHPAAASIVDSASPVRSPHPRRQSVAYATSRNWIRSSPSISTTVPFAPHRKLPASPLIVAGCCRRVMQYSPVSPPSAAPEAARQSSDRRWMLSAGDAVLTRLPSITEGHSHQQKVHLAASLI